MKNKIECSNCGNLNSFFRLNCTNCNAIIREKIVNIDLWDIFWKLIEFPKKAFTTIIQAENKNFVVSVFLLVGFKIFLHSMLLNSIISDDYEFANNIILNGLLTFGYYLTLILIFSFIIFKVTKASAIECRFRDYYSILIFSQVPMLFSLIVIMPVEYALFGKHWFTANPSPFAIKPMAAWVLFSLETMLTIWSIVLTYFAIYVQTNKKAFSIGFTFLFYILIAGMVFLLPYYPF